MSQFFDGDQLCPWHQLLFYSLGLFLVMHVQSGIASHSSSIRSDSTLQQIWRIRAQNSRAFDFRVNPNISQSLWWYLTQWTARYRVHSVSRKYVSSHAVPWGQHVTRHICMWVRRKTLSDQTRFTKIYGFGSRTNSSSVNPKNNS